MATKKETVTEEIVETAVQEDSIVKEAPSVKKTTIRKFAPDDMITCRSITYGELLLTGTKSKLLYSWSNYGDTTEVEFQDLQALKSTRSSYLFRPRFVIEDEELAEQWSKDLGDMYKEIVHVDVEDLFKLPLNQFKAKLKKAPKGVQQAVKNIAGEKIMNGSLDSLSKIKAIDEILGTDLKLYLA